MAELLMFNELSFMKRLIIGTIATLLGVGMTAQEKTVVQGEFEPGTEPAEVEFFYRSGESLAVPVKNHRFRVELPTDKTKSYDVSMGRYTDATIVPEGGTLTISRRGNGRYTVSSDKANSLSVRVDSLISFRRRNYKDSTLMINEYKRVVSANRDNAVGYVALFFLTNFGNTDPRTKYELVNSLSPEMLVEPRTAKLKSDIEALYGTSVGMMFKDFSGVGVDGGTLSLSDFAGKGKYLLLDFWSTGCGPCRKAFPHIRELYDELAGETFDILGVPVWEEASLSRRMIKDGGLVWHNILATGESAASLYGVTFVPTYLLLGPDGKIIARDDLSVIESMIRKLVK